jgi:hypothetical protein
MPMSKKPSPPEAADDARRPSDPAGEEPGSNAVEHEPDPHAKPIPDGEHKYIRRSPYTSGTD